MVIVDRRGGSSGEEGARKRLKALHNRGVEADLGTLDYGDYAITGNGPDGSTVMNGVELKTSRDILTSLRTNRLKGHQVPGMVEMYEGRAWLLTEGIWREHDGDWEVYMGKAWQTFSAGNRRVQMKDIECWILSTVTFGGLMYWHCPLQSDTARFIATMDHLWNDKDYDHHRQSYNVIYRKPPDRVAFTKPSDFVQMVSIIDKVGWEKARALEAHFINAETGEGDWEKLMAASAKTLQECPGIGKTIAENIIQTLHRRTA